MNTLFDIFNGTPQLSAGIISADLLRLGDDIVTLEQSGINLVHFDVIDGHFAPPLTVGPAFIAAVKTKMFKDVHLMIDGPLDKVNEYAAAGADMITVHVEACAHAHRTLQYIGELKNCNNPDSPILKGIAINPSTPIEFVYPLLDIVDMVMLVAINPGFHRQVYIESTGQRLVQVRNAISKLNRKILIAIDGGINDSTIATVAKYSPDMIVTGSAIFQRREIKENIAVLNSKIGKN